MKGADSLWRIGGEVEPCRRSDIAGDGIHFRRSGKRGEEHFRALARFASGFAVALAVQVEGLHGVPRPLEAGGDRAAHGAEADEADLHAGRSSKTCFTISAALPAFGQPT